MTPRARSKGRHGMTLVELLIYMYVAGLVLTAILSLFYYSTRAYSTANQSFHLTEDLSEVLSWLRRDLQETTLGSIRVYPHQGAVRGPDDTAPGISMASPHSQTDPMQLLINSSGVPAWRNHVYYTLLAPSQLVRWEDSGLGGNLPLASATLPSEGVKPGKTVAQNRRTVAHTLQPANQAITAYTPGGVQEAVSPATPYGGFEVAFVRQAPDGGDSDYTTSVVPPGMGDGKHCTPMVQVTLRFVETSARGKPSLLPVTFRVTPRL